MIYVKQQHKGGDTSGEGRQHTVFFLFVYQSTKHFIVLSAAATQGAQSARAT